MSCVTDLPGNISTPAILGLGVDNAISSCLELANGDVDYIRFDAEYGKVYDVFVSFADFLTQPVSFELLDYRGWVVQTYLRYGDHLITLRGFNPFPFSGVTFTPHYTGTYYLRVAGAADVEYTARAERRVNDTAGQPVEILGLGISSARIDELETASDDDRFSVIVKAGRRYFVDVFGVDTAHGTLADPWVGIQLSDRTLFDDNSGAGRNAYLSFVPVVDGGHYVVVGGAGAGTYRVALHVADDFAGNSTTAGRVQVDRSVNGDISQANDIDWFRVSLQSGQLYRFQLEGTDLDSLDAPLLILRNPGLSVVAYNAVWQPGSSPNGLPETEFYFQATHTGDHFAIARSVAEDLFGDYRLTVDQVRPPIFRKYQNQADSSVENARFYKVDGQIIPLSDLFHTGTFTPTRYQFYSALPLERQGAPQPAGQVLTILANELGMWRLAAAFDGRTEILVRAETAGNWSEWLSTPVYGMVGLPQLLSGFKWNDAFPIRYEYVSTLPAYFAGVYTGFQAIDKGGSFSATVDGVRNAAANWGQAVIAEADAFQPQGQIKIFLADNVSGYFNAFLPGPDSGGDIVLNKQYFGSGSAFEIPSTAYVELVRALGRSLGLNEGSGLTRSQTVMATAGAVDEPYAWTPTRHDLLAIRTLYRLTGTFAGQFQYSANRGTGFRGTTTSAFATSLNDVMKFKSEAMPRRMDLRPGSESFEIEAGLPINRIIAGWETAFYQATGGSQNDVIFGNGMGNLIDAGAGGDYLEGREGDDSLRGGPGSDWYGYTFGGGHDDINDNFDATPNPGNDTIRVIGWGEFRLDSLPLNFSFHRMGGDLNVNLSLDGGPAEGSIRIENMTTALGRIESLEMYYESTRTARISLVNLFSQLTEGETRKFRLTTTSDTFGQLVIPN